MENFVVVSKLLGESVKRKSIGLRMFDKRKEQLVGLYIIYDVLTRQTAEAHVNSRFCRNIQMDETHVFNTKISILFAKIAGACYQTGER